MNTTLAGPPRRPQVRRAGIAVLSALLLAAVVAGVLVSLRMTDQPSFVSTVTVANPTVYQVEVDVSGTERAGWLSLGAVRRESEQTLHEVADQGDPWVFRFRYAGRDAGELVVSRAELEAGEWRVTIPPEVGERLRELGIRPSAR